MLVQKKDKGHANPVCKRAKVMQTDRTKVVHIQYSNCKGQRTHPQISGILIMNNLNLSEHDYSEYIRLKVKHDY